MCVRLNETINVIQLRGRENDPPNPDNAIKERSRLTLVPEDEAVGRLIDLIKEHHRWIETPVAAMTT